MQNAKDTFYEVLRDRLAALDPDRTIVVRGVTRPAILVDENETTNTAAMDECFHLRWGQAQVVQGPYPLATLPCEVTYSTLGNAWNGGLDRGRVLAAMDADLLNAVRMYPQNAGKKAYRSQVQGGSAVAPASRIWWSDVAFGTVVTQGERLTRTAVVQVMSLEEGTEQ